MIGKNIKKARLLAGLSQTQLGEKIGKGVSTISEWESDKRSPDVDLIPELSKILNVSQGFLMGMTDNPKFVGTEKEEIVRLNRFDTELLVAYNLAKDWQKLAVRKILDMDLDLE